MEYIIPLTKPQYIILYFSMFSDRRTMKPCCSRIDAAWRYSAVVLNRMSRFLFWPSKMWSHLNSIYFNLFLLKISRITIIPRGVFRYCRIIFPPSDHIFPGILSKTVPEKSIFLRSYGSFADIYYNSVSYPQ